MSDENAWTDEHTRKALRYLCAHVDVGSLSVSIERSDVDSEGGFRRAVVRWIDIFGEDAAVAAVRHVHRGYSTSVSGSNYVLHLRAPNGRKTLCGRVAQFMNCTAEPRHDPNDEEVCGTCRKQAQKGKPQ